MPIKALILRQLKFFTRYKDGLLVQTRRVDLFNRLMEEPSAFFLQYYINISNKYGAPKDIYKECSVDIHKKIHDFTEGGRYKYKIYIDINPIYKQFSSIMQRHSISIGFALSASLKSLEVNQKILIFFNKFPIKNGDIPYREIGITSPKMLQK